MEYKDKFIFVKSKKPQSVTEALFSSRTIILKKDGSLVEGGIINLISGTYAILYCEDINNISIVTTGANSEVLTFFIEDDDEFDSTVDSIREVLRTCEASIPLSPQNIKLNSYAVSIAEKLRNGVELRIVDVRSDDDTVECPSCGAINDWNPSLPYCLECGSPLTH